MQPVQEKEKPKDKNNELIAIRLPESLLSIVDALAISEGRNRSGQIRHIINAYAETHYGAVLDDLKKEL